MQKARDIKRRIKSIQSTMQLTRAMKMVAAAKLRKAQERILAARPYAAKMLEILNSLATRSDPESHPLLAKREEKNIELVILTADKGLCGSFNSNILRAAVEFLEKKSQKSYRLQVIGKKGRNHFKRRKYDIRKEYIDIFKEIKFSHADEIAQDLIQQFVSKELDAIYLIHNSFKSMGVQRVMIEPLLPIQRLDIPSGIVPERYQFEPSQQALFNELLPKHVTTQIYCALLDSSAAEHAARMTAMDAATKNASDLIDSLTLQMNRVRQNSITSELIEIVSGAEALRKGRF